jgi:uncharacterized membrane protein YczE
MSFKQWAVYGYQPAKTDDGGRKMNLRYPVARLLVYLTGVMIYAYGVCLMTKAAMGISPISSVSYIFTFFTPATLGMSQFFWNSTLIVVQIVLLRRAFQKVQLLQFGVSLLFSVFIDALMPFTAFLSMENQGYAYKSVVFAASLAVLGLGLGLIAITNLIMLPGDGLARSISAKFNLEFGKAKVLFDCICVVLTCIISYAALRRIEGIQMGTVIAALLLGHIARFVIHTFTPVYKQLAGITAL